MSTKDNSWLEHNPWSYFGGPLEGLLPDEVRMAHGALKRVIGELVNGRRLEADDAQVVAYVEGVAMPWLTGLMDGLCEDHGTDREGYPDSENGAKLYVIFDQSHGDLEGGIDAFRDLTQ